MSFAEQLIGALLDRFQSILGQVREQKVHARPIWVHLPASHGRAVQLVDHPAHRVQRGVVAHERITAWPVDLPVHHAADRG